MKHPRKRRLVESKLSRATTDYVDRAARVVVSPGEVATVVVAHDSACGLLAGGDCNCVPDMTVTRADGRHADVGDVGEVDPARLPS